MAGTLAGVTFIAIIIELITVCSPSVGHWAFLIAETLLIVIDWVNTGRFLLCFC